MTEKGYTPGQVYEIRPLIITPDRVQTFGQHIGGGYTGNGDGWGPQEGPRRGESGSSGRNREIALPNVMAEFMNEQIHSQAQIDREYGGRFETIVSNTEHELQEKKDETKNGRPLTTEESVELDRVITLDLIHVKASQYSNTAPNIYGFYGQSPYFLMMVLPRQKMRELLNSGNATRESLIELYALFDNVYKSAMELKALSISIDILASKFSDLANQARGVQAAISFNNSSWHAVQNQRFDVINSERDIHVQQLPEFLQSELIAAAGSVAGQTPVQALAHYRATLDHMAETKTNEIGPIHAPPPHSGRGITITYPANNPKINAPLSKPELEALNELVYLQLNTPLGVKWLSYHQALLKSESARHLIVTSNAFQGLIERLRVLDQDAEAKRMADEQIHLAMQTEAKRIADEQIRIAMEIEAERMAAEQDRINAEAEAQRIVDEQTRNVADAVKTAHTFRMSGSISTSQSIFTTSAGAVAVIDGAALTLEAAIRTTVAAVTSVAAGTASGLMVGIAALVYPSKLADGELPERYAFSTPLSNITGREGLWPTLADAGGTVSLPARISSKTAAAGQSELIIVKTDGVAIPSKVKVIEAVYNTVQEEYTVITADIPPRTIIWTPIASNENASTSIPAEQSGSVSYTGATITPVAGRIDSFPGIIEAGFDDFITVFPSDSGLPPVYVMFKDRRDEPGTATGAGHPVTGIWLGAASDGGGAPIPSQIALQLTGKNFRNFRAFREAFWQAVANDTELSRQFSPINIMAMKKGYAAFVRKTERRGARNKYELHHKIHLFHGGDIYNVDNIYVTTPTRHIEIHKEFNNEQ
ncbi:S-type pyocin domain-containing protein [Pseudomonas sp. RGM 3321]|uniref:S-type pyocin domain-containing protein n=1 Tax=Pseudomonas sp. RGM 3321 TaxID=2930089 RepID=UPI001FCA6460|nr:S-type pyocin domain-containing protein [Pseudomonas sp. RGM 3321]MCJ2371459.1 S-type pyocin domain-containing protein [Pseudomonas sp. RGM 3321]